MDYPEIQVKDEPYSGYSDEQVYDSQQANKVKDEPIESVYDYDYFSPELMASIPEPLFPDLIKTDSELFSVAEFLNTDMSPATVTTVKTEEPQEQDVVGANGGGNNIVGSVIPEKSPSSCTGMVNIGDFKGSADQNKNTGKIIIARPKKASSNNATTTTKPYAKSTNTMECQYCGAKFSSAKWFSKHFCPQMGEQLHGISVVNLVSTPQLTKNPNDTSDVLKSKQRNIYSTRKCRVCDQSFPTFSLMFEHFMSHYNLKDGNTQSVLPMNVQLKPGPSLMPGSMIPGHGTFKRKHEIDDNVVVTDHEREHNNDVILIDNNGMTIKQAKYEFPNYPIKIAPASSSGRQGIKICKECGQSFHSQSQLVDHFLTHYNLTLKRNPPVSQHASNTNVESSPTSTNNNKKPQVIYTCNQCTGQFPSITRLRQHQQNVHTEEEAVQCKVCESWFNSQKYLLRHMQRKHEATAECNVCHQKFTEMELPHHYLKHFNMKL